MLLDELEGGAMGKFVLPRRSTRKRTSGRSTVIAYKSASFFSSARIPRLTPRCSACKRGGLVNPFPPMHHHTVKIRRQWEPMNIKLLNIDVCPSTQFRLLHNLRQQELVKSVRAHNHNRCNDK